MVNAPTVDNKTNNTKNLALNDSDTITEVLNDLITTNRGMIDVYQTAVSQLIDIKNIELLQGFIEMHERFATELSNLIVGYGGTPMTTATTGSMMTRVWVTLKAAFTVGDGSVLAAVTQDAENVLAAYSGAMGAELPDGVREMVRQHLSLARLASEKLSGLSEAYNN